MSAMMRSNTRRNIVPTKRDVVSRVGFKWGIPEMERLYREYDLLELSIDEMAELHGRSPIAIMSQIDRKGLAYYDDLLSNYEWEKGRRNEKNTHTRY